MPSLAEQCDPRQKFVKRAKVIPWQTFVEAYADLVGSPLEGHFECLVSNRYALSGSDNNPDP